ncbi:glycosyltransferase [Jatrophihabitans endophyticus]|uniref:glycosyltransferase n=1 Tax=Jatrophihabitans endophyticus TaxID=1206085 RepID=UPI001A023DE8|nr:glycosyltransferase [Jatrophihabitans endophyticus]MBE7189937.1 glycosyltransferase family 4 protein [Jatrophihabitans endophyticus]
MTRHPRVVWFVDDRAPTGATTMALRRAAVLRGSAEQTVLALRRGPRTVPRPRAGTAWSAIAEPGGLTGEMAFARADVVVTTSELTLASAAARATGRSRLVHVVHEPAVRALARPRVARALPLVDWLLVPAATDLERVSALAALPRDRIVAVDDFTLPGEALLSSAAGRVVLAAGRIGSEDPTVPDPTLDVVDGFVRAYRAHRDGALRGWQLRLAGDGPGLPALLDHVDGLGAGGEVVVLGAQPGLAAHYLDAGVVVRVALPEANGLSVVEGLAAGVPVVSSPASPAAVRHVRHGVNGTMLEDIGPDGIAAAFVELADPQRRAAYAAAARADRVGLLDPAGRAGVQDLLHTILDHRPLAKGVTT